MNSANTSVASDRRFDADPQRYAGTQACLLVVVADRLSDLLKKGEVTPRYYNPGGLFREVHLLLTNDDRPDPAQVQPMVGDAKLQIHNLPPPDRLFYKSLGWWPVLMRSWTNHAVSLARTIRPELVRTHNNFFEGNIAVEIKQRLGVPFITSLHGVWDKDNTQPDASRERFVRLFRRKLEKRTMRQADAVIAVYKPVVRYAKEFGARDVRLIYNAVSSRIEPKSDYAPGAPPRLVTINRQTTEKNPANIIRATAGIDCHYTIVGDGPLHDMLQGLARECGVSDRIDFVRALPNDALCKLLPTFDLMVSHCDYWGISKTTIEASLAGLPTVLNHHPVEPIPDCEGGWVALCDNTVDGYREAIGSFLASEEARQKLGRKAFLHAREHFHPAAMESKIVELYRSVLNQPHHSLSKDGAK